MKRFIWGTAAVIFFLDRLTKWLILRSMEPLESIPVIPGIFHITFVKNPGAAFGMLAGQRLLFLVVTALVLGFVIYYSRFVGRDQVLLQFALGLQVGGALGNFVDRMTAGQVIDFMDFRVWPVFNVADAAIVVGTGFIIVMLLRSPEGKFVQES